MSSQAELYLLTFSERAGYLYADLKGDSISAEIIRGYVAEIVERCEASGHSRILLYRDIPAVLGGSDVFFTVNESLEAFAGKKLALVNPHEDIAAEVDFGVTVGQNRGGNYRTFDNVADAEAWLLKS